ncbi:hypothetical protein HNP84_001497 [Thermocatellispora tengchongensis]|uniref:Uncharacterized protein n=1 Tax=Thermocatellispora tengchongensis TaxID=1073253 RepID=A0A840NSW5_9ACTN|nr:hypothetical protein [Thermocatellispora tengchongensis]
MKGPEPATPPPPAKAAPTATGPAGAHAARAGRAPATATHGSKCLRMNPGRRPPPSVADGPSLSRAGARSSRQRPTATPLRDGRGQDRQRRPCTPAAPGQGRPHSHHTRRPRLRRPPRATIHRRQPSRHPIPRASARSTEALAGPSRSRPDPCSTDARQDPATPAIGAHRHPPHRDPGRGACAGDLGRSRRAQPSERATGAPARSRRSTPRGPGPAAHARRPCTPVATPGGPVPRWPCCRPRFMTAVGTAGGPQGRACPQERGTARRADGGVRR